MRVSLIGCGRWGRNILRDLRMLGSQVAVADPDATARSHATAAGAYQVVDDLDDLPESDGIVVATPTSTHATIIGRALNRNVPIFSEKPLTNSPLDARLLAERAAGRLFVMDKWRYHPGIEELRRIREREELGLPFGMHLRHIGWGLPHRDVDVAWILLPHCLSIGLEVLGHLPAAHQAFAEQMNGQVVNLTGALSSEFWITLEVSSRAPVKRREFRLHCEHGVAWLDAGWTDHIHIARGNEGAGADAPDVEKRFVSPEMPLERELRAFLEHLNGGPPPRSSAAEGVLIVERIHELLSLARVSR